MFIYQKNSHYFGQIADDLKALGIQELEELGAENIQEAYRGVYFNADKATLYKIVYCSRLFSRFIAPLEKMDAHSTKYLHKRAMEIDWDKILTPDKSFAIFSNVSNSAIKHSKYAALCLKDAIADFFNEKYGRRPNVNTENPNVWLNLYIHNNKAEINFDLAGGSLHKRGYRKESVDAPLQEALAAAFIRYAKWDGQCPLYDPMCGSGTIAHEALMHYCRIPAGYLRKKFGFMQLPDYDAQLWNQVRKECNENIRPLPEDLIFASDIDKQNLKAAKSNGGQLPHSDKINYNVSDFQNIDSIKDSIIITNPPYGLRLNKNVDMQKFVKDMGDFLKQRYTGTTAYIYFDNRKLIKSVGLRTSAKAMFSNGGLDGRLAKYEMY